MVVKGEDIKGYNEYGISFIISDYDDSRYKYHTGYSNSTDYEIFSGHLSIDGKVFYGYFRVNYYFDGEDNQNELEIGFVVDVELRYILPNFGCNFFKNEYNVYVNNRASKEFKRKYKIRTILNYLNNIKIRKNSEF